MEADQVSHCTNSSSSCDALSVDCTTANISPPPCPSLLMNNEEGGKKIGGILAESNKENVNGNADEAVQALVYMLGDHRGAKVLPKSSIVSFPPSSTDEAERIGEVGVAETSNREIQVTRYGRTKKVKVLSLPGEDANYHTSQR